VSPTPVLIPTRLNSAHNLDGGRELTAYWDRLSSLDPDLTGGPVDAPAVSAALPLGPLTWLRGLRDLAAIAVVGSLWLLVCAAVVVVLVGVAVCGRIGGARD
jgi:hypothetical protein